jgi:hypothetical protein
MPVRMVESDALFRQEHLNFIEDRGIQFGVGLEQQGIAHNSSQRFLHQPYHNRPEEKRFLPTPTVTGKFMPPRAQMRGEYQVPAGSALVADRLCSQSACAFSRHWGQMLWVKSAPVCLWK